MSKAWIVLCYYIGWGLVKLGFLEDSVMGWCNHGGWYCIWHKKQVKSRRERLEEKK